MMSKYKKYIPELCYWGILPCLWIVATQIIPSIRLPFSLMSENETSAFNTVVWTLAASYLAGIIVYYLTITHKNRKERRRRKWELRAVLIEINHHVEQLESDLYRSRKQNDVLLNSLRPDTIYQTFLNEMSKTIDKAFLYKDILIEGEAEALAEIRQLLIQMMDSPNIKDEKGPNKYSQEIEIIKANIVILQKSIDSLFGRKQPGLPSNN